MAKPDPTLVAMHCKPLTKSTRRLNDAQIAKFLPRAPHWFESGGRLYRTFKYDHFRDVIAHMDAAAKIWLEENHFGLATMDEHTADFVLCTMDVGGLTENDFIVAAKISAAQHYTYVLVPKKKKK